MRTLHVALLGSLLLALAGAPGAASAQECATPGTLVVFSNGMFTSFASATQGAIALQTEVEQTVAPRFPEEQFNFALAYNQDEGLPTQLLEVARMRGYAAFSDFLRHLNGALVPPESLAIAIEEAAVDFSRSSAIDDGDLSAQVQFYRGAILEGNRLIIVAHSQGNLYANEAHDLLTSGSNAVPTDSLGIVSVATPAPRVNGGGPHTTQTNDLVMVAVREIFGDTLPANATNSDQSNEDFLHHGWLESYLYGDVTGERILEHISGFATSLARPTAVAASGAITVTLEWGSQPDLDLHVFEPDGTHVDYRNRTGTNGELDVDDTSGFGPEHYTVACDRLAPGTYTVGVNYYAGSSPEVATVQVAAGLEVRTFPIQLTDAVGSGGNDSPVRVADVIVTFDEVRGTYDFDIQAL